MAVGDKNELLILISTLFPDNNEGSITPADIRTGLSQMVTYDLNLSEETGQAVSGPIEFSENPTLNGQELAIKGPNDGGLYVWYNDGWIQKASFMATTNATISVNGDSAAPSFLPIDALENPVGISLVNALEGSIRNDTGHEIKTMTGTVSFNPDVTGGGTKRVVLVSETSIDNGLTWQGNLNSIRKVEIGSTTESFKTNVSLVIDWPDNSILRFRAYDETLAGLDFIAEAETILAQSFTGPALVWDLSEK